MKKRNLWTLWMVLCLAVAACGGSGKEGEDAGKDADIYKPYPLDENDSALMGAMDRAHAEFGNLAQQAALQRLEGTFLELDVEKPKERKIVVKEVNGNLRSFFLSVDLPESAWKPYEDPAKQGEKIVLQWRTADRVNAKGEKTTVEECVQIEN